MGIQRPQDEPRVMSVFSFCGVIVKGDRPLRLVGLSVDSLKSQWGYTFYYSLWIWLICADMILLLFAIGGKEIRLWKLFVLVSLQFPYSSVGVFYVFSIVSLVRRIIPPKGR